MTQLAEFLMKYGPHGLAAILLLTVAFLYREARKSDKEKIAIIREFYEKAHQAALKSMQTIEAMRKTIEDLVRSKKE